MGSLRSLAKIAGEESRSYRFYIYRDMWNVSESNCYGLDSVPLKDREYAISIIREEKLIAQYTSISEIPNYFNRAIYYRWLIDSMYDKGFWSNRNFETEGCLFLETVKKNGKS